MGKKSSGLYVVRDRRATDTVGAKPRLIRGAKRASVENFLLQDFDITPATNEELHSLGVDQVPIENAGDEPEAA